MSAFDASFAAVAIFAFFAALTVFLYALLARALQAANDDGKLRLDAMLQRHGVALGSIVEHYGYQAAIAARRCVLVCPHKAQCDAWLRSGGPGSIGKFCPNADFIHRLAAGH